MCVCVQNRCDSSSRLFSFSLCIVALSSPSHPFPLLCLLSGHLLEEFIFSFNTFYIGVGFPRSSVGKESACKAEDLSSIPGLGRSPGEGNDNPLQYSCLENPMDRGAWWATVYGVIRVRHDLVTKPPELIYNVVLVSGVKESDSVVHVSILFQNFSTFRLLQSIEQSSLYYTVVPCRLSILNIVVCTCQSQTPNLSTFPPPPLKNSS